MSIVLPERERVEEYMIAQAMIGMREKEGRRQRPAHGTQTQVEERVWRQGVELFTEPALPIEEPLSKQQANKGLRERIDVENERLRANDPSRLYRDEVGHADLLTPEEVN